MKKATFIIAVAVTLLSVANMIGSHSTAAIKEPASNVTTVPIIAADADLSSNGNNDKGTTTSKTEDPAYIAIAMYNDECITLDCYNSNQRKKAISNPTVLKWPGYACRDVDLIFVGPQQISQIRLVDKNYKYISNISFTIKDKGVTHCHFVMDPKFSGYVHTKEGDDTYVESAEFYFEIYSADGTVSYTSVWYK